MGFPSKLISSASVRPGTLYTHQKHNHFPNMVSDWLHDTLVMVNAFVVYITLMLDILCMNVRHIVHACCES